MRNISKVIVLIICGHILNSCSFVSLVFIQNLKNEDVNIDIKFDHNIEDETLKNMPSLFSSNVTKIKDFKNDENTTKLEYKIIDEKTISVIFPKNSITLVDRAINKKTNISEISIENEGNKNILDKEKFLRKTKIKKGRLIFRIK